MLAKNAEAARLHTIGLDAENQGNYAEGTRNLGAAMLILSQLPSGVAVGIQSGHVERDLAMTKLRQGLEATRHGEAPNAHFDEAKRLINESVARTGTSDIWMNPEWSASRAKADHAEICAAHGATLGVAVRIEAALRAAGYSLDTSDLGPDHDLAAQYLMYGHNAYYSTSNKAAAARYERSVGHRMRAAVWAGRLIITTVSSVRSDPVNRAAAIRTAVGRLPHLRSQRAAQQSILTKP